MKRTINLALLLMFSASVMFSCQPQAEQIPGYENTRLNPDFQDDIELIQRITQAFFTGDAEAMDRYLHENYMSGGPDYTTISRQEEIDGWVEFAQGFKDARLTNDVYYSFIVDEFEGRPELLGKWMFVWADMHYTRISDGKEVSFPIQLSAMLEGDQLLFTLPYFDRLSLLEQLGYKLVLDEDAEDQ